MPATPTASPPDYCVRRGLPAVRLPVPPLQLQLDRLTPVHHSSLVAGGCHTATRLVYPDGPRFAGGTRCLLQPARLILDDADHIRTIGRTPLLLPVRSWTLRLLWFSWQRGLLGCRQPALLPQHLVHRRIAQRHERACHLL